ncbi:MAG TPA: 3,4-dihydroxy-2-butanone-4-phosphate synthase, partial [Beijerinckiaceae bacterium]|nr:3,4-dihydroxy-2-butanone-4-phosphate synthase [Beijerinckiaceae bacterium]
MPDTVTEAVEAFARGEIVIVTDDNDRENEGDLTVAASLCTPEKMAFIIRHTCGIVCAPLTVAEARRLRLDPMVAANDAPHGTAFTVSVDARPGLTTGISAEQRSNTVRALANNNMGASDFVRPGHVFPLIAKDGGVLMRSGHTEAAVDLCRLAELAPVAAICELANDDGTVMKGPQIAAFAAEHGLRRISVADLIAYRQAREKLVERLGSFPVRSEIGELTGYAYATPFDPVQHFAFVHGRIGDGRDLLVRLHRADVVADIFSGGRTIHAALRRFAEEGRGVLVYLRDGT